MAARKEILSDLSSKIADGNIRDAYRTFEDLPVVDQIAVSISPGVGDALAAYEVGEFGEDFLVADFVTPLAPLRNLNNGYKLARLKPAIT